MADTPWQKAWTVDALYLEAVARGLVTPILPMDFREMATNDETTVAFGVAERHLKRAVAALMRRVMELEAERADAR